jgi:hypothetical protein
VDLDILFQSLFVIGAILVAANIFAFRQVLFGEKVDAKLAEKDAKLAKLAAERAAKEAELAAKGIIIAPPYARGFGWKALSPLIFAAGVLFSIALGGMAGTVLFLLVLANLIFGLSGWKFYVPGRN